MSGSQNSGLRRLARSVPRAQLDDTAERVRQIASLQPGAAEIAVLDHGRLVGLVPAEALVSADPRVPIQALIDPAMPVVSARTDQETAAQLAAQRGARAAAVIEDDGRLVGVVPPERLLAVLLEEHEEDLARLGGSMARSATEEPVRRRLAHRLPWLTLGVAGAMLSTGIVASFEEQLRAQVLFAFFVPAVVYMADAIGTQTETVIVRGMSVGVSMRSVARREIATGALIGIAVALAFFVFVFLVWQDARVALVVALALFASASVATAVAMTLPYALARFGADPAFGSGPLATVIQDLLSILIYFSIAVGLS